MYEKTSIPIQRCWHFGRRTGRWNQTVANRREIWSTCKSRVSPASKQQYRFPNISKQPLKLRHFIVFDVDDHQVKSQLTKVLVEKRK